MAFVADVKQAEELLAWEAAQATEAERWTNLFGPAFQSVGTDWEGLRKAITWTRRLRECVGVMQAAREKVPALTGALCLQAATGTPPSARELRRRPLPTNKSSTISKFVSMPPALPSTGSRCAKHTPETVLDLLGKWRERVGELSDWVDWRYLPERFGHLGLKSFWDQVQQGDIVKEQIVDLFLKSFWSAWLDAMFQADPRRAAISPH